MGKSVHNKKTFFTVRQRLHCNKLSHCVSQCALSFSVIYIICFSLIFHFDCYCYFVLMAAVLFYRLQVRDRRFGRRD